MVIHKNESLQRYNTFGIACSANEIIELNQAEEIPKIIDYLHQHKKPLLIIGGGSNVLFTTDFDGIILANNLKGISITEEDQDSVTLEVAAGEVWHDLVMYCVENNYAGMENLSLIPGKVGASPMQNIGAYGVEVKDLITSVKATRLSDGSTVEFSNAACDFGYRTSIFKTTHKNQFLITSVRFKLSKKATINTSYGAINAALELKNISQPTIKDVSDAVISIRSSKLPNPSEIGNAGSFFKNPVVTADFAKKLQKNHPNIPVYDVGNNERKLAAGWLIEQCGWKGKTINDNYGVHKLQALVLVNYGGATGKEIYDLSREIINSVNDQFGVVLEREVNII